MDDRLLTKLLSSEKKEYRAGVMVGHDALQLVAKADHGDLHAMLDLIALLQMSGQMDESVKQMYLKYLRKLCRAHVSAAYVIMGNELVSGKLMKRDIRKALECYDKAIDAGEISAYEMKAALYYRGEHVHQNIGMALMYYRTAYENYCEEVREDYEAYLVTAPDAEELDEDESDEMVTDMAYDRMMFESLFALGEVYRKGLCGRIGLHQALDFYLQICVSKRPGKELDDYYRLALYRAGIMILKGEGCDRDPEAARSFLELAEGVTLDEETISADSRVLLSEILSELESLA